jgi:heme oxygenase
MKMTFPLSVRLREGTKESHRLTESTMFIREFFAGRLSIEAYREFLVQFRYIYAEMENHQERHRTHCLYEKIYFPELYRTTALIQDLNFYYGNGSWREVLPHRATAIYIQRLTALSYEWVEGLVAHHYTRYLGDLSGGQALKQIVAKMFKLLSSEGLAFYEFSRIMDYRQFKDEYRARLDAMPVDDTTSHKIVEEANHAFKLNRQVFDSMMESIK